jgi:hypothetical protein
MLYFTWYFENKVNGNTKIFNDIFVVLRVIIISPQHIIHITYLYRTDTNRWIIHHRAPITGSDGEKMISTFKNLASPQGIGGIQGSFMFPLCPAPDLFQFIK